MKAIRSWDDLRCYGIIALTGEACMLGQRILCDLTKEGMAKIRRWFGLPDMDYHLQRALEHAAVDSQIPESRVERIKHDVHQFDSSMNSGDSGNPDVASMMIFRTLFADLAAMCLLEDGAQQVVVMENGTVYGIFAEDLPQLQEEGDKLGKLKLFGKVVRRIGRIVGDSQPAVGMNAVHAFSGRCAGDGR